MPGRKYLSCDICGTFFDNDKDYMNHLETAHKRDKEDDMKKHLILILLFVAFWFKGHTLYWTIDGEFKPEWKMDFMLGYKKPNTDPIERIEVTKTNVRVIVGRNAWTVVYGEHPGTVGSWWVSNPERVY